MTIVPVTGVSTWGIYTKCMIFMLQLGVHVLLLFVQLHVMGLVQQFLIVIVNMEYHIIVFIVRDLVFQICIVSAEFYSSRFCWVIFKFVFLWMSAVHGEFDWRICSSPTVCSQFRYESSTDTRYLKLALGLEFSNRNLDWKLQSSTGTHISVEMVMFLQLANFYWIICSIISDLL